MTIEADRPTEYLPGDTRQGTTNNTVGTEYELYPSGSSFYDQQRAWHTMPYDQIVPHENSDSSWHEMQARFDARYAPDLSVRERLLMSGLMNGASAINAVNRHPLVQRVRQALHIPLPEASTNLIRTEQGSFQHEPTPWEMELSSYRPEDREVAIYSSGKYDTTNPKLIPCIVSGVIDSAITTNDVAFNSLFRSRRNDTADTRIPYTDDATSSLQSSIAVVFGEDTVKVINFEGMERPTWDQIETYLYDESTPVFTLEQLNGIENLCIHHVIDASGISKAERKPPYMLLRSASSGFSVDTVTGEIRGSFDHQVADGTPVQTMLMTVFYNLDNHHKMGELPRDAIALEAGARMRFLSEPENPRQVAQLENLPALPLYTDRMLVSLISLLENPETADAPTVTGTATSEYPFPISGDSLKDVMASLTNRIGITQETVHRHQDTIELFMRIKEQLRQAYGDSYMEEALTVSPEMFLGAVNPQLLQELSVQMQRSREIIKSGIADARADKSFSLKIAKLFHGKNMDQWVTRLSQRVLPERILRMLNGTMLLTDMKVNEQTFRGPDGSEFAFDTVTPDKGKIVLSTLNRKILIGGAWFRRNLEMLKAAFGSSHFIDRDTETLTRTSHLVSWKGEDGFEATQSLARFSNILSENWLLMCIIKYQLEHGLD